MVGNKDPQTRNRIQEQNRDNDRSFRDASSYSPNHVDSPHAPSSRQPALAPSSPYSTLSLPRTNRSGRVSRSPIVNPTSTNPSNPSKKSINGRSRSMSAGSRKAPLQIKFLIVGGGIAGLACAFTLARSGHNVEVLEKWDGIEQRSAGVRVPPNMSKILSEWGLQDELSKSQKCRKSAFHSMDTGELMGYLEWQEDVIKETGGEFLLMHYEDLLKLLQKRALSVGARIRLHTSIVSIQVDQEKGTPSLTLADGTIMEADVIIGADGHQSAVREFVTGRENDGVQTGMEFFTLMIPAEKMKSDPDWAKWINAEEWPMWMGDSRTLLGYPVRNGNEFCLHAYWQDTELLAQNEAWDVVVPTSIIDRTGCHPSISRLFSFVPEATRVKYVKREIPEDWVDDSGRVVVIGEAAHPFMPYTIHNSSLAIEDASVLGCLMSRLSTLEQIPQFLDAFQDLRRTRCCQVQQSELNNAALVTLPPGEHRDMRNAGMRMSLQATKEKWSDEQLREQWEDIGEVFGYHAQEAAEDWWIKWGVLGDTHTVHEPLGLMFEVTKVAISQI